MKRWLNVVRHGRELRHVAVAVAPIDSDEVRAVVERRSRPPESVTHVPVALHPLTLGLFSADGSIDDAATLVLSDQHWPRRAEARIHLDRVGAIQNGNASFVLYRPRSARNGFQGLPRRLFTYWLATRSAHRKRNEAGSLGMTALELIALDCYYVWPRPVYIVSVQHGETSNIFPMDLVGPIAGTDHFTVALRNTSPSVSTIRASGRAVFSVAPPSWKEWVYALGAHHRKASIDTSTLPFRVRPSKHFGLPTPIGAHGYRELEVIRSAAIGSHTFFVCRTIYLERPVAGQRQLAHVSNLYARWRAKTGRPMDRV